MNKQRKRRRNRLKDYDYSGNGYYFVTICTKNKVEHFGEIQDDVMILNRYGQIVQECWCDLPNHYWNCVLDEFIIMPDHVHGIVIIDNKHVGTGLKPVPTGCVKRYSLSEMMRGFKTFSSRKINEQNFGIIFQWQRSFYDHIIRNEQALDQRCQYIQNNPLKWAMDWNNPDN